MCIHLSVDVFFFTLKKCETFVCVCSSFAVATVNGKWQSSLATESFPCLSPSASALAALSVYKTLSAIVLLHGIGAGVGETTAGPYTF